MMTGDDFSSISSSSSLESSPFFELSSFGGQKRDSGFGGKSGIEGKHRILFFSSSLSSSVSETSLDLFSGFSLPNNEATSNCLFLPAEVEVIDVVNDGGETEGGCCKVGGAMMECGGNGNNVAR